jgi:putative DNA primase/helicase
MPTFMPDATPRERNATSADVIAAFLQAMGAAGIEPAEPIEDRLLTGQRFYFRATLDKPRQRKAWAFLRLDARPAGAFGHFKADVHQRWRFACSSRLSAAERHDLSRKAREAAARREAVLLEQHRAASSLCQHRWQQGAAVDPNHPYLRAKGIAGEGLRQSRDFLLVPMLDSEGLLWNIQTIAADGAKRFANGARQKGLHLLVGDVRDRLAIAEGYGTAAVIRRATGLPVAVAFSASNLVATAKAMRARFPAVDIVIGADDDAHLVEHPTIKRNLGLDAARAAAQAVGGRVALPPRTSA